MIRFRMLTLALLAAVGCKETRSTLPYYDTSDFTPKWSLPANGAFHTIRPFTLVDQDSEVVTERDLAGKISVVSFFFATCPDVCPITIKSMLDVQAHFKGATDVVMLSHTVTPRRDSVAALRVFAREKGVDSSRWKLLTGSEAELYDLGKNFYFLDDDQGAAGTETLFTHTENFVLVDKQRHLRGIYNGMDPNSMQALVRDINVLRAQH